MFGTTMLNASVVYGSQTSACSFSIRFGSFAYRISCTTRLANTPSRRQIAPLNPFSSSAIPSYAEFVKIAR